MHGQRAGAPATAPDGLVEVEAGDDGRGPLRETVQLEVEGGDLVGSADHDDAIAGLGPQATARREPPHTTLFEDLVILAIILAKTELGLPIPTAKCH